MAPTGSGSGSGSESSDIEHLPIESGDGEKKDGIDSEKEGGLWSWIG